MNELVQWLVAGFAIGAYGALVWGAYLMDKDKEEP